MWRTHTHTREQRLAVNEREGEDEWIFLRKRTRKDSQPQLGNESLVLHNVCVCLYIYFSLKRSTHLKPKQRRRWNIGEATGKRSTMSAQNWISIWHSINYSFATKVSAINYLCGWRLKGDRGAVATIVMMTRWKLRWKNGRVQRTKQTQSHVEKSHSHHHHQPVTQLCVRCTCTDLRWSCIVQQIVVL